MCKLPRHVALFIHCRQTGKYASDVSSYLLYASIAMRHVALLCHAITEDFDLIAFPFYELITMLFLIVETHILSSEVVFRFADTWHYYSASFLVAFSD